MLTPIVGIVMAAAAIGVPGWLLGWLLGWLGCCDDRPEELGGGGVLRGEQRGRLRTALWIQEVREHVEGVARGLAVVEGYAGQLEARRGGGGEEPGKRGSRLRLAQKLGR
jgi:hypothetical protein